MNIKKITTVVVAGMAMWASAGVVSNVNVSNRYPWNGMVDIKFNLSQDAAVTLTATDTVGKTNLTMKTLSEAGVTMQNGLTCLSVGDRHVVWNAATDYPNSVFQNVDITVTADEQLYMVINLTKSGDKYPVTYLAGAPKSGWAPEYKTKYLVLRKIKAGTFTMGSPSDEWGRSSNETQSEQTIDNDYYIGIYEITSGQQFLVTGGKYTYHDMNGQDTWGAEFPAVNVGVDDDFLTKLSDGIDMTAALPTETQWEYACRAGSSASVYTGVSPTSDCQMEIELAGREVVGHKASGYTWELNLTTPYFGLLYRNGMLPVGMLQPNPWGLYDMLGNRAELCAGGVSKGASAWASPSVARAARKGGTASPTGYNGDHLGFRIVVTK